jgi:hypothetical protein
MSPKEGKSIEKTAIRRGSYRSRRTGALMAFKKFAEPVLFHVERAVP